MARIISLLILLITVGVLAADPIEKSCNAEKEFHKKFDHYKAEAEAEVKIFVDAPGPVESKYNAFSTAFKKIAALTKTFYDTTFTKDESHVSCFEGYPQFEVLIGHLVRYLHAKAETTEKEYLAVADEKISKKVADKATEIDACYEHSRNLAGVKPEETTINFCSYNMDEAVACAKKIFGDDHDEPLLNLISFTNFFVAEFDCKTEERDAVRDALTLISFDELTSTSEHTGRQTFFYGWVETTKNFIKKN